MAENFVNILREIRGKTLAPATDKNCIYGDIKWMYGVIQGYQQITPEERLKLKNIEEEATKNSSDAFLLSRANHTGTISMAYTTDSNSRFAMTIDDKNKLDAAILDATKNDTDANLRNRATHTGVQSIDTIADSSTHVKMTINERNKLTGIQTTDEVKDFIKAGTNVTVSYDSITNELTISANDTSSVEWSEIQNKPSPTISVEITGDASGSANTTLTELASGSIEINNLTLSDTGTAGTYRKITTDSKGRVISGEGATTIAEYEITDAYTKTEIDGFINNIDDGVFDLVNEVALKAYAHNATLTGVPTAPTAAVGDETTQVATTAFVGSEIDDKAYSKTQLDAGQLDNRYYTETEIDTKLAEQNDAIEISYDGTTSGLIATNVQDAIDIVEDRLDVVEGVVADVNLTRADKVLASKDVANLIYSAGNLVKIRYTIDDDVDYEVLTYVGEDLTNVAHYVNGVLQGNTVLTYASGELVSSIFIGV